MKLAIILPAYNEEKAIEEVIKRTLQARENIIRNTPVTSVEIIVVDDGSKDKTSEIAQKYSEVQLIHYPDNRGYGYAIKKGFASTNAELLSFFDVDGTCDPNFLVDLVKVILSENSDLALGSRLGGKSQMPKIRKMLNLILAFLVNIFAYTKIEDMASGMRVIKSGSLNKLYPLPDGLNFTPAMSCRAAFDDKVRIVEKDMPYYERIGKSKLNLMKDGFRFLKIIFDISITYKPIYFFFTIAVLLFSVALFYGIDLVKYYVQFRLIGNYYHRLSAIIVFILIGSHLLLLGLALQRAVNIINNMHRKSALENILNIIFVKTYHIFSILLIVSGIFINKEGIKHYLLTGLFKIHWLNITVGGVLILLGVQIASIGLFEKIFNLLKEKKNMLERLE